MKKRLISLLLACIFCLSLGGFSAAAASPHGSCGSHLSWSLDQSTGVLTVSGSGQMDDYVYSDRGGVNGYYPHSNAPWWDYRHEIRKVVVEYGVTSIGDYAFSGFDNTADLDCAYDNLKTVDIADTVTSIGYGAFSFCIALTELRLPDYLQSIAAYAFSDCYALPSYTIPESVTYIGNGAFQSIFLVTSVMIPAGVRTIGELAIGYTDSQYLYPPPKVEGFTISGYIGTAAETYARDNGFPFIALENAAVSVTVDGTPVRWTDAIPFIDMNSRTMVPLRAVGDALGLTVSWDKTKREAIFTDGRKTIYFPIDSSTARTGDGGTVQMDTAAVIVNNRTYAPVRYLAEYFGFTVGWDGSTKTVLIRSVQSAALDSATVVLKRMNCSYWMAEDDPTYGKVFVNHYYDLASITDANPMKDRINAVLRSEYDALFAGSVPYSGGFDEGTTNFSDAMEGEIAQNSGGILSVKYHRVWWMGGVADGSASGITVSLETGERLYLSDLRPTDGRQITFRMMEALAIDYYDALGDYPDASALENFRKQSLDDLDFYIENNQIILCIAKYALASGAAGPAEIPTGLYIR